MKYYMYKYVNNDWYFYRDFDNYEQLIAFLYNYQDKNTWRKADRRKYWNNDILDNINMSGHDISYDYERHFINDHFYYKEVAYIRPYMFYDEDNRIIDARRFYNDIIKLKPKSYYSRWMWERLGSKPSRYRRERTLKYGRIIRMVKHPDFKEYNRIGNLKPIIHEMAYWDRPPRNYNRSWKTSYKCRKQWMKNMK